MPVLTEHLFYSCAAHTRGRSVKYISGCVTHGPRVWAAH
eukprot:SAG11_NODE_30644_length_299_cov_0.660000_2_plen_38_part_01